jgi:hypothetical protein
VRFPNPQTPEIIGNHPRAPLPFTDHPVYSPVAGAATPGHSSPITDHDAAILEHHSPTAVHALPAQLAFAL